MSTSIISSITLKEKMQSVEEALLVSEARLKIANEAIGSEIDKRKKAEKETLDIIKEEQKRVGSQLHDGLCQELAGILMFAKSLTQKMEKENRLDVEELKKISDLLGGAVKEARDTARGLYPGELEGTSLMHILEELTVDAQKASGITCSFHCPETILINENEVATHLYKITQEGISNAVKHGDAKTIEVSLMQQDNNVVLTIKDNGIGFINDPHHSKGIGLKIMQYRAHMMDATFEVKPNVPHGVILTCSFKNTL